VDGLTQGLPGYLLGAALGLGLAAAVGFRVFVPFLLVSIAAQTGRIQLADGFDWLGSDIALVMFGVAAALEVAAYLIPYFDHLLDTVAGPVAVVAGTLLMASTLFDVEPWLRWVIAVVAGGGTAGLLKGATSTLRLGSTATTAGAGNPVFATLETGAATALTILALAVPLIALALVVFLMVRTVRGLRRGWRRFGRRHPGD
jgi:hypothetical protein